MLGRTAVEVVRRLPVVMKEAAIARPFVAVISCEEDCGVAMMARRYNCNEEEAVEQRNILYIQGVNICANLKTTRGVLMCSWQAYVTD